MMTLRGVSILTSMHLSIYSRTMKGFIRNKFQGKSIDGCNIEVLLYLYA